MPLRDWLWVAGYLTLICGSITLGYWLALHIHTFA